MAKLKTSLGENGNRVKALGNLKLISQQMNIGEPI